MFKKKHEIVGIVSGKKASMPKNKKPATPFFQECVETFFLFYEKEFGLKPSFDGSSPRDLKWILEGMKKRSEENGFEWTAELAKSMLKTFLETAIQEQWLKENFLLFNLNRQKDKLFFKIKNRINEQRNSKKGFTREGVSDEFNRRNYANRGSGHSEG